MTGLCWIRVGGLAHHDRSGCRTVFPTFFGKKKTGHILTTELFIKFPSGHIVRDDSDTHVHGSAQILRLETPTLVP